MVFQSGFSCVRTAYPTASFAPSRAFRLVSFVPVLSKLRVRSSGELERFATPVHVHTCSPELPKKHRKHSSDSHTPEHCRTERTSVGGTVSSLLVRGGAFPEVDEAMGEQGDRAAWEIKRRGEMHGFTGET